MTHFEFLHLTDAEQYEVVLKYGVKIGERKNKQYSYRLYQVFSFYLEGKTHIESSELKCIHSFSCTEALLPYIENISLTGIV